MKLSWKKVKLSNVLAALLFVAVLASLLSAAGATLAKYLISVRHDSTAVAAPFYFTSDVLQENDDPYQHYLIDEPEGNETVQVSFTLSNYIDELRCTDSDIQYTYRVLSGDGLTGTQLYAGSGTLTGGSRQTTEPIRLTLQKSDFTDDVITIEARASTPYEKTLYAQFGFTPQQHELQWRVTPYEEEGVVVITIAGGSGGDVIVRWPPELVPDLSNSLFREQQDQAGTATFTAQPGVRYALTFFTGGREYDESQITVTAVP